MFCKFCGNQMDDNAAFCSQCGKSQTDAAPIPAASAPAALITPEEERKGMSIYLSDVCALEFVVNKLRAKQSQLKSNAVWYQCYSYNKEYALNYSYNYDQLNSFNRFLFGYDGRDFYFGLNKQREWVPSDEANLGLFHPNRRKQYYTVFDSTNTEYYTSKVSHTPLKILESRVNRNSYWYKKLGTRYDVKTLNYFAQKFEACWQDFQKVAPIEYQRQQKALNDCQQQLTEVESELAKATALLEKEYALNIIPSKFRSLAAMYYICDYFNSSAEPLTSILLQLNLDEIKSKLDTIIANQQQIIINQAIQISQNEQIIFQNEQTLKKLASLEQSAARTNQLVAQNVQWTQVAANNAEACALIAAAQYIRSA